MNAIPENATRKSKMFWVKEESQVRYLKCYECPPNDDVWWCPEAGFSGHREFHFFDTREEASQMLKDELEKDIKALKKALSKL